MDLQSYRQHPKQWQTFFFKEVINADGDTVDINSSTRHAILLHLQYDWRQTDKALIRALFEQEVISREEDDYQGIGEALWLGAYLLAKYKDPADIELFYRAKFANFDTACGFDREFIYWPLREQTDEYLRQTHPDIYEELQGDYIELKFAETLEGWWRNLDQRYPNKEKDETLLALYERYFSLDQKEKARHFLDQWASQEKDSDYKYSALKFEYTQLGDYDAAIEQAKLILALQESDWDRSSALSNLIKLHRQAKRYHEGYQIVQQLDQIFATFDRWKDIGLGRIAIHETFELSLASEEQELARQIFNIAHEWAKQCDGIAWVGLQAAWKAAEKCDFTEQAHQYRQLADAERKRIDREVYGK